MKKTLMRIVNRMSRRQLALGEVLVAVRERETREVRWDEPRPASSLASLLGVLATLAALGGGLVEEERSALAEVADDVACAHCESEPTAGVVHLVEPPAAHDTVRSSA
jgi:hypothetical protein